MTTLSNNTPQFPLAPSDGRSFFEATLSEAQKRGLLSKEAVQKILDDGPKGMIQIAQTFGNVHHAWDIEKAKNRLAHLVSLGLEDISGGDIQKAILALRGGILPLSKRGSELIKKRIALRAHPDWIEAVESDRELRNQMYDTFAPTSNPHRFETKQGLSYRELLRRDIEDATKKTQLATTIQKMLRAQRISPQIGEIQWMDTLVHELFPRIVTGKTLDFEAVSEIQKAYQKDGNTQQKQRWDAFLKKFEAGDFVELQFQSVLQVYISELQASKEIANQDGANDGFHGEAEPSYTNWNTLTQGKRVSDEVLRTAVLSGYVMGEMKLSISQAELETILRTIRSKKLSLEGCIDYAKTSIPEWRGPETTTSDWFFAFWDSLLKKGRIPKWLLEEMAKSVVTR